MNITLADECGDPLPSEPLVELARVAMQAEELPASTQLSITLVSDAQMSKLNADNFVKQVNPCINNDSESYDAENGVIKLGHDSLR